MKATVDIPSDELRDAMRFTKSKTKREAIRLEPDAVPSRFGNGPEESEATALAVHGVLPGGERDVATGAGAALPDREANQLEASEDAVDEVDLRVGQLSRRVAFVGVLLEFPAKRLQHS